MTSIQRLQKELDAVHHKKHLVRNVQQDPAPAFPRSQLPVDGTSHDSDNCLLIAVALLCGHLIPLSARASELAYQKNMLNVQFELFKKFKQQVHSISFLGFFFISFYMASLRWHC